MDQLSEYIQLTKAVQDSTFTLKLELSSERIMIDMTMEAARANIQTQKWLRADPKREKYYNRARERLEKAIEDKRIEENKNSKEGKSPAEVINIPNLNINYSAFNIRYKQEIQQKIEQLRDERTTLLTSVFKQLNSNKALFMAFKENLTKFNGDIYWDEIDPSGILRQGKS